MYSYKTWGVCSRQIDFDIIDGKLSNVKFYGGCNGNTQGLSKLLEGMDAKEAVKRLKGTDCSMRGTSCPDQLARAIEEVIK